jgi:hypothetical protein
LGGADPPAASIFEVGGAKNAENLLMIEGDPELVVKYSANWKAHERHSASYEGRRNRLLSEAT